MTQQHHCTHLCNDVVVAATTARERALAQTRERILEVARELLGQRPEAGIGEIAEAASVVRRTVYDHFPSRDQLVATLAARAGQEIAAVLDDVDTSGAGPDEVWARFVDRLWPLAARYRVLLALRRGKFGDEIHRLLGAVDDLLAELILRGQQQGVFGEHLPADALARVGYGIVFAIADDTRHAAGGARRAAIFTSLLVLGVPDGRASVLADAPFAG